MSERHARTHTSKSNRARDNIERKTVYKSVLDNPFQLRWPSVPENVQNAVLAGIISALDGVADMHHEVRQENRKRKKEMNEEARKKAKLQDGKEPQLDPAMQMSGVSSVDASQTTNPHATMSDVARGPLSPLDHLTFGINEVAKVLEEHAHHQRRGSLRPASSSDPSNTSSSKLVAVCLADVNPPTLVGHLPNLVAACNSVKGCRSKIWLVPLPKGAEEALAAAAGLKRAAAIAIDELALQFTTLRPLLDAVPLLTASWLYPGARIERTLIPTHVKQLKTTAPKDMRAAKEMRAERKAAAKQRQKVTQQSNRVTITAQQG